MNLNQLRYFVAVAKFKNLSKASEVLGIAQPAISRQIRLLETELGVVLLSRHTRGVEPTDVGILLLQRAEFLLRTVDETRSQVNDFAESPCGSLRIGCPPAVTRRLLARPLTQFMSRFNNVRVELKESTSEELCKSVLTDQLDLALVSTWTDEPYLTISPLFSDRIWLFGPTKGRRYPRTFSLDAVSRLPLLVGRSSNAARQLVERGAGLAGLSLNIRFETDSVQMIHELAAKGFGYALVPYSGLADAYEAGSIFGAPVADLRISRSIIRRSDRPINRAAGELFSFIEDEVKLLRPEPSWGRAYKRSRKTKAKGK